jgi:hypothetical protein
MQNRKEDFTEFLNTIKKEVHEGESRHLWASRIFVYICLFLLVIFVGAILFTHFNLFHTDVTSARYMLSALVQSQAAIVAIVITLTLIAVQLTASAYSPRVIDIFKKNPDMWILLGCYAVSIFYGFIILKLVEGTEGEVVSQSAIWTLGGVSISFEFCVSLAYWLGAFTFVVLFLYMWYIISLLKPESIIKRLAVEITKDKILEYIKLAKTSEGVEKRLVADPIQPIVDIIHGAIMKYDLETTRVGLKAVTDQALEIIGPYIDPDNEESISEHFCSHLTRVGRLAISREDAESTIEVSKNLENFGTSTAEKGLENATELAVGSLADVGKAAAGKGLENATVYAARSLGEVGKAAAGKGLENATMDAGWSLGKVGKAAAGKGLEHATVYAVWSLENVGKAAAGKGLEHATELAVGSLADVGKAAAEKGLENATVNAGWSLGKVGKAAAGKGLAGATQQAAGSLAELTILSEEKVKTAIQNYESHLEEKDHDSSKNFMKLYEQKLEKLRAEK